MTEMLRMRRPPFRYQRRRSFATLIGNSAYAIAQLGVLIVLARGTSPSEVGRYALALAIAAPIQLGLGMRLRTVLVVQDATTFSLATYFRLATVMASMATVISTLVALLVLPDMRTASVVFLVATSKAVESIIDVTYGELQRQGEMGLVARSQVVRGLLTVTGAFTAVWLGFGAIGVAASSLLLWISQLTAYDIRCARRVRAALGEKPILTANYNEVKKLARSAWPLGLAAGLTSLSGSAPRLVTAAVLGTGAVGALAILSYPTTVMTLLANSLGQAHLPELRRLHVDKERRAAARLALKSACVIVVIGAAASGVLALAGGPILETIFGGGYAHFGDVATVLMLAATAGGVVTSFYYLLTSTGAFGSQPIISALGVAIGLPIIWGATQQWGLVGTAWGMVVSLLIQACVTAGASALRMRKS